MDKNARLLKYFRDQEALSLRLLRRLVELESPTSDKKAVDKLVAYLAGRFGKFGVGVEVILQENCGNHLRITVSEEKNRIRGKALILCHLDTVWPKGEILKRPFKIEGNKAYGPGVLDMKASILLVYLLVKALRAKEFTPRCDLVILFTSDEETGSHSSRAIIEQEAQVSDYVLVLEPPLPGNRVKTQRKGVGHFQITVFGRAAHAGVDHEKGVNAIEEMSHQILSLQAMTDYNRGVTVNVGVVRGGTVSNVVPAEARAEVDIRFATLEDGQELERRIKSLRPVNPGARIEVSGGINRPPFVRSQKVVALYEKARALAAEIGMELGEGSTGGGSDGSFTAALGVPTLDGLGVDGAGPHAVTEHINIDDIPYKATLLARILETV